jgi:hypothetical protein
VAASSNRPAQFGIQSLNGIRRVDHSTDVIGEGKEGNDFGPVPAPGLDDRRVFAAPWPLGESLQGSAAGIGVLRPIDPLESRGNGLAILVGDELQGMPQKVDDGVVEEAGDR